MSFPCIADVNMLATLLSCTDPCDPWQPIWPDNEAIGPDVMDGALVALLGNPKPKPKRQPFWEPQLMPVMFRMDFYEHQAFTPRYSILAGF